MTRKSKLATTSTPKTTNALDPLFGPPPLLEGEDTAAYDELLARVSGEVKPTDIIEEIWVRDVVDLTWEGFRWRRMKITLLAAAMLTELEKFLVPLLCKKPRTIEKPPSVFDLLSVATLSPPRPELVLAKKLAGKLAKKWAARDPAAIERVAKLMASENTTWAELMARVFVDKFDTIDRIDRSIMTTDVRRNAALREIDRHRLTFAQTLRYSLQDAEEAEFKIVEPKKIEPKNAGQKSAA